MSDPKNIMDELQRNILSTFQPPRIDVGEVIKSAEVAKVKTTVGILERFSVAETIAAIDHEIKALEVANPERYLVVTMRTIDGRIMDVQKIRAEGFSAYIAEGFIEGMPCMIAAHASTLNLFIAFEEKKGRVPVGFIVEPPRAVIEPQPESEPIPPDKKQSAQKQS